MLSIAVGYDVTYLTKEVAPGCENYYLSAVAEHGEPPGIWWGRGAQALGLNEGVMVDNDAMKTLYEKFVDPNTGEQLGRRMSTFAEREQILAGLLAKEPNATPERRAQLEIAASKQARSAVHFLDLTFSPPKSVTLLHAGLQASAQAARESGDVGLAGRYEQAAGQVWDSVMTANNAMLGYVRDHAGDVRVGYHGAKVAGRSTGRWADAGGFVVASFRQHTSRTGDPQLHVHNAVLNRQLSADGKWRSLDSRAIHKVRPAAAAVGERVLYEELTRATGVDWVARADGNGLEVAGIEQQVMDLFSTRRSEVLYGVENAKNEHVDGLYERIAAYTEKHGHQPGARVMFQLAQEATKATKQPKRKSPHAPNRAAELAEWERRITAAEMGSLVAIPGQTFGRIGPDTQEAVAAKLADLQVDRVICAAIADVQASRSTFTRYDVTRFVARYLPPVLGGLAPERVQALLEDLTDQALDPAGPAQVRLLTAPDLVRMAPQLQRENGLSVYDAGPTAQRYITAAHLDREQALIGSALSPAGPRIAPEPQRETTEIDLGSDVEQIPATSLDLEAGPLGNQASPLENRADLLGGEAGALGDRAAGAVTGSGIERTESDSLDGQAAPLDKRAELLGGQASPLDDRAAVIADLRARFEAEGLNEGQAAAVAGILTSGRRTDVLIGPAGTGKTFTIAALATQWREQTQTPVVGLTTSQAAAYVLAGEGLDQAWNIERWLTRVTTGEIRLVPGQLIVVDEAGMASTEHLARIQELADAHRCKVLWAGDIEQIRGIGAAGAMRHLAEVGGAYQLTEVVRFANQWERDASLRLRDGDANVLAVYDAYGRLDEGDREAMERAATRAYLADTLDGRQSLLLAPTNAKASELSARIRASLVAYGHVDDEHVVHLRDGNRAGSGDVIMARANDQMVRIGDTERPLTNRDLLKVSAVDPLSGTIWAHLVDQEGRNGAEAVIDGEYVGAHVELAYAGTVHSAQGRTVDTSYSLVDDAVTREMLYVMLTRGRWVNKSFVVTAATREADLRRGPEQDREAGDELRKPDRSPGTPEPEADRQPGRKAPKTNRFGVLGGVLERTEDDTTGIKVMLEEAERPWHLAHLGAMHTDTIRQHIADAYINRAVSAGALTPEDGAALRADEAKGTLGRLLRAMEVDARHDVDAVMQKMCRVREFDSARSHAEVLHWRITELGEIDPASLEPSQEHVEGTWLDRTPTFGDANLDQTLRDIAELAEARIAFLGDQAALYPPTWLSEVLDVPPVSGEPREAWAHAAGRILAYREQYGITDTRDPIGAAPGRKNPEQLTAWRAAYDALGRPEAFRDVAEMSTGDLWMITTEQHRRDLAAPPHVAAQLRAAQLALHDYTVRKSDLRHRAAAAADPNRQAALLADADGQRLLAELQSKRVVALTQVHEQRQEWMEAGREDRALAERADQELRRRMPQADREEEQRPEPEASQPALPGMPGPAPEQQPARQGQEASEKAAAARPADRTPELEPEAAEQVPGQAGLDLWDENDLQLSDAELDDPELAAVLQQARDASRSVGERTRARQADQAERAEHDERARRERQEREPRPAPEQRHREAEEQRRELEKREADRGAGVDRHPQDGLTAEQVERLARVREIAEQRQAERQQRIAEREREFPGLGRERPARGPDRSPPRRPPPQRDDPGRGLGR